MDLETYWLLSILFGSIGIGYFLYGRRQRRLAPSIAGALLCVYPYFISSAIPMIVIGVGLVVLPYFVRQ